ncbi:hypothetical protein ILUMI_04367 [Ignelater luminosus]|uniref:Peptidase S1 domain-containing protein n=1 Tax=Ignelater luminosus TaxID=2038154 RepID=A0A8K0D996_IGNLU|nr:hypothetical protein ILUMI_04367 [Ignelater luminosus]
MFICPISYISFALCYDTVFGEVVKEFINYRNIHTDHVWYRIVNGNDANIKDYPFAALLFFTQTAELVGGATIIASLWTVTTGDIGTTIEKWTRIPVEAIGVDFHTITVGFRCRLNLTTITPRMVCAFGGGTDPCTGDVGSALLQNNILIGKISHLKARALKLILFEDYMQQCNLALSASLEDYKH